MKSGDANILTIQIPCKIPELLRNGVLQICQQIEMVTILGSTKFHQNIPNFTKDKVKTFWYKGLRTEWKDKKSLEVSQHCKRSTVVFIEE